MSHDKCLNCGFELPDSPREKRYMAGLGSLQNAETEALVAANIRITELESQLGRLQEEHAEMLGYDTWAEKLKDDEKLKLAWEAGLEKSRRGRE